jgi:hypothetical protein
MTPGLPGGFETQSPRGHSHAGGDRAEGEEMTVPVMLSSSVNAKGVQNDG